MAENVFRIQKELKGVDAVLINTFIKVFRDTLNAMGGSDLRKGALGIANLDSIEGHPLFVIGIGGEVAGAAFLKFTEETAIRFASSFLLGVPIDGLDDMARNSLEDFVLRVSENIRAELDSLGYFVGVTNQIHYDEPLTFEGSPKLIKVPLHTTIGDVELYINLYKINGA